MKKFEIKEEHLRLLKEMHVDTGSAFDRSPRINWKRPYGNSDYIEDVCAILGFEEESEDEWGSPYSEEQIEIAHKLHKETAIALQICLIHQKFETGTFVKTEIFDDRSWKRVVDGKIPVE